MNDASERLNSAVAAAAQPSAWQLLRLLISLWNARPAATSAESAFVTVSRLERPIWGSILGAFFGLSVSIACGIALPVMLKELFPSSATQQPSSADAYGGTTATPSGWADVVADDAAARQCVDPAVFVVGRCAVAVVLYALYHATSMVGHVFADRAGRQATRNATYRAAEGLLLFDSDAVDRPKIALEIDSAARTVGHMTGSLLTNVVLGVLSTLGYFAAVVAIDVRPAIIVVVIALAARFVSEWYRRRAEQRRKAQGLGAHVAQRKHARVVAALSSIARHWDTVQLMEAHAPMRGVLRRSMDDEEHCEDDLSLLVHSTTAVASGLSNMLYVVMLGLLAWFRATGKLKELDLLVLTVYMKGLQDHGMGLVSEWTKQRESLRKLEGIATFTLPRSSTACRQVCPRTQHALSAEGGSSKFPINTKSALGVVGPRELPSAPSSPTLTVEARGLLLASPAVTLTCLGEGLRLARGACYLVVGPSGSGKSTLMRRFAGLIGGEDHGATKAGGRLNLAMPYPCLIEQVPVLLPELSLAENVALLLTAEEKGTADAAVEEAVDVVNMSQAVSALPRGLHTVVAGGDADDVGGLSQGQLQRLCIARALFSPSPALLFDEPTSALDAFNAAKMVDLVRTLVVDRDKTVVVVTHTGGEWASRIEARGLADRTKVILVAEGGSVHEAVDLLVARSAEPWRGYLEK